MSDESSLERERECVEAYSRLTLKANMACAAIFILAVVRLIQHGIVWDYPVLLLGSVLSVLGMMGYTLLDSVWQNRRGVLFMLVAYFGGGIPYIFGCYLILYRGLWRLIGGFSFNNTFKSLVFIVLGYWIVSGIYEVTEFVLQREGPIPENGS